MIAAKSPGILMCLLLFCVLPAIAGKKKEKTQWRYEVSCAGIGVEGTKLVKVWTYSRSPRLAIAQAKKNAVHAMLFKGFAGDASTGCPSQHPLLENTVPDEKTTAFLDQFFADGGDYEKYVSISGENTEAGDRLKTGKEYKIAVIVTVMYSQLRKDLEKKGIVKPLTYGF